MDKSVKRFVVVESDEDVRSLMVNQLKKAHFPEVEVNIAGDPDYACVVIGEMIRCEKRPDLVFTNFKSPNNGTGLKVIRLCKEHSIPVVLVCSDCWDHEDFTPALELVGGNFIPKPINGPDIRVMAEKILGPTT